MSGLLPRPRPSAIVTATRIGLAGLVVCEVVAIGANGWDSVGHAVMPIALCLVGLGATVLIDRVQQVLDHLVARRCPACGAHVRPAVGPADPPVRIDP